jgi:hypothetical protein
MEGSHGIYEGNYAADVCTKPEPTRDKSLLILMGPCSLCFVTALLRFSGRTR